jgi:hypothetical protein
MIDTKYTDPEGKEWHVIKENGRMTTIDPQGTQLTTDLGFATAYKFGPDDCPHRHGYWTHEVDGSTFHCSDCDSMLDEHFEIVIRGDAEIQF